MKRYKDCALICNEDQQPLELLDIVMQVAEAKGYKVNRYSSFSDRDTLAVYIREQGFPYSRLIICVNAEAQEVSVVNIVPMPESGISHIDCVEYNLLLDRFRDKVFASINSLSGNTIRENTEDYTIKDIIPLSFDALNAWLNGFPLSAHPMDTNRWYAFIVALHSNNEYISTEDFGKYIREEYGWSDEDVEEFSLKLEAQIGLLEYYDRHR